MRRVTFILLFSCAVALSAAEADVQTDTLKNHITIDLNYRARGQVIDGALPKPSDPLETPEKLTYFLENRIQMRFTYQWEKWLEACVQLHGSGVWGSTPSLGFTIREARVTFRAPFGLFGEIGRIPLSYDDERIIGMDDWAMMSLSHDVMRFGYEGHGHKVHAILAYNHNDDILKGGSFYDASVAMPYKLMTDLWYNYEHPDFPLGVSALFMNIGLQAGEKGSEYNPPKTVYQQVMGGYAKYHPDFMTLEASGYYQRGWDVAEWTQPIKVKAWMASVKADVHFDARYGFVLGYDYMSGDDYVVVAENGGFGTIYHEYCKGFRPVYGSRYKFYGIMDYFYQSAYNNGFTPGLQNAYLGFHTTPVKGLDASVNIHYLAAATKMRDNLGQSLGTSLDLQVGYQFNPFINLTGSFSYMHGTETMQKIKQGYGYTNVYMAWLALVVNPTIFNKKW